MIKQNNIFIVGPTGAGKTTVGRLLAEQLKLNFYDLDAEIEKHQRKNIAKIFTEEGEKNFRKYEEQILAELTALNNVVLSTGAGAIISSNNREKLKANGTVVYLQVSQKEQYERLKDCQNRPLLPTENRQEIFKKMSQERDPLYAELADIIIDSSYLTVEEVVKNLVRDI